jgi:hypothetical protein
MTNLRRSPNSPKHALMATQAERALALRVEGKTLQAIADELDVSKTTAHNIVVGALNEVRATNKELAQLHLQLELERCDQLQAALAEKIAKGDVRAVEASIKVMDRRAKLLGLDAAQKLEHAGPDGGPINVDATSILDGLARLAGDGPADPDASEPPSGSTGDDPG